ncbi:ABC transporter ATP-binding protein [Lysinibacillus sp. KU-BSD001]|uniref:ABC transporter ATP-binding protein n=1 Tax=Lysinibacillus sp. KU-BSD001 TaxID=3141328 RepID=UPI0036E82BE1
MIVQAQGLKQVYGNGRGLHEATFDIPKGRIIALAGGNGAGKSTLIRMLTKQEMPQQGQLIWHEAKPIRYMPDDVDFPNTLTAAEVLKLLASLKKATTEEQHHVLKRVGLFEVQKQTVRHFSKGMRQRLNLAQSLLGGDGLLIMDEPTNGLDPYWIAELKNIIRAEKERGSTIIFSTHMLSFAEQLADDVIILHEGSVLVAGELQQLLQEHGFTELEQLWLSKIGLSEVQPHQ